MIWHDGGPPHALSRRAALLIVAAMLAGLALLLLQSLGASARAPRDTVTAHVACDMEGCRIDVTGAGLGPEPREYFVRSEAEYGRVLDFWGRCYTVEVR